MTNNFIPYERIMPATPTKAAYEKYLQKWEEHFSAPDARAPTAGQVYRYTIRSSYRELFDKLTQLPLERNASHTLDKIKNLRILGRNPFFTCPSLEHMTISEIHMRAKQIIIDERKKEKADHGK